MTEVSDEFKNQALFDLNMEGKLKDKAAYLNKGVDVAKQQSDYFTKSSQESEARDSAYDTESRTVKFLEIVLNSTHNPELKTQAEAHLDRLFKDDKAIELAGKKGKNVDLDGSKKSLFGKLKNKVHNFWKPNNEKKALEEAIGNLQEAMGKDPDTFKHLRDKALRDNKGNCSFNNIITARNEYAGFLHSEAVKHKEGLDFTTRWQQKDQTALKETEAQMEARLEVRDNVAKEIELRSAAREGIGIKDINANSGVDKLADRAKAMEGMTPQQRLAFRMKELRGTKKETAQPVVKRELDSNIMSQKLNNQRQ